MDPRRNQLLAELAQDATLERSDFVVRATDQLRRFLEANSERIEALGGIVLFDEDPDYLSVAPDLSFRSRTRYQDENGEWVSETEVIESIAELVELYNPADLYAAFIENAQEAGDEDGGEAEAPGGVGAGAGAGAGVMGGGVNPYAAAADEWAASQAPLDADDDATAAARLYDLALDFQARSQATEARLVSQFETTASNLANQLGEFVVVDDDEQRLVLTGIGAFRAEVLAEDDGGTQNWRSLESPDALVEYYDPTDIFGDLADALAEAYPGVATEEAIEPQAAEPDADAEDEDEDEEDDADDSDDSDDSDDEEVNR